MYMLKCMLKNELGWPPMSPMFEKKNHYYNYHTEATSVVTKKGHAKTTPGCLFGTMDRPRFARAILFW